MTEIFVEPDGPLEREGWGAIVRKGLHSRSFVVGAAITLAVEPLSRSLQALLRRSRQDLASTWRGFAMLYRDLPNLARAG